MSVGDPGPLPPIAPLDVPGEGPGGVAGLRGLMVPQTPAIPGPQGKTFTPTDFLQVSQDIQPIQSPHKGALSVGGNHRSRQAPQDSDQTFESAHNAIQNAADDIAPNHANDWQTMSGKVGDAHEGFRGYFNSRSPSGDPGWQGQTASAIKKHAVDSLRGVEALMQAAGRMSYIVDMFSRDITTTKQFFTGPNWALYNQTALNGPEAAREDAKHAFDILAANFMRTTYRPAIDEVAGQHPDVSGVLPPSLGTQAAGPTAPGTPASGGGGGGQGLERAGLGAPASTGGAGADPAGPSAPPGGPSPSGGGSPAKAAGDGAGQGQNGSGQAGNGAQKGLGDALNGDKKGLNRPPEGILNLGPKGQNGAGKAGGGARGAGGGGARPALPKPADARMAAASKPANVPAPTSRAGLSNSGGPGAGAPAAGQRGSAADKVHKASKALHLQKNGEEITGDSEAIVPVIGDEAKKQPPPTNPRRI